MKFLLIHVYAKLKPRIKAMIHVKICKKLSTGGAGPPLWEPGVLPERIQFAYIFEKGTF